MSAPVIPTREEFQALGPQWERGWRAGAEAEAACRNEGMSREARDVRSVVEGFARLPAWQQASKAELAGLVFHIYGSDLPLRKRLWLALVEPSRPWRWWQRQRARRRRP
jgi:hypothetical protein